MAVGSNSAFTTKTDALNNCAQTARLASLWHGLRPRRGHGAISGRCGANDRCTEAQGMAGRPWWAFRPPRPGVGEQANPDTATQGAAASVAAPAVPALSRQGPQLAGVGTVAPSRRRYGHRRYGHGGSGVRRCTRWSVTRPPRATRRRRPPRPRHHLHTGKVRSVRVSQLTRTAHIVRAGAGGLVDSTCSSSELLHVFGAPWCCMFEARVSTPRA